MNNLSRPLPQPSPSLPAHPADLREFNPFEAAQPDAAAWTWREIHKRLDAEKGTYERCRQALEHGWVAPQLRDQTAERQARAWELIRRYRSALVRFHLDPNQSIKDLGL